MLVHVWGLDSWRCGRPGWERGVAAVRCGDASSPLRPRPHAAPRRFRGTCMGKVQGGAASSRAGETERQMGDLILCHRMCFLSFCSECNLLPRGYPSRFPLGRTPKMQVDGCIPDSRKVPHLSPSPILRAMTWLIHMVLCYNNPLHLTVPYALCLHNQSQNQSRLKEPFLCVRFHKLYLHLCSAKRTICYSLNVALTFLTSCPQWIRPPL